MNVSICRLIRRLLSARSSRIILPVQSCSTRRFCSNSGTENDDDLEDWNDAWDTAWIPEDTNNDDGEEKESQKPHNVNSKREQIETLMTRITQKQKPEPSLSVFQNSVEDQGQDAFQETKTEDNSIVANNDNILSADYRLRKQSLHAAMWHHQIDLFQESKISDSSAPSPPDDDIDQLLEKCSEFFVYANPGSTSGSNPNFKAIPEGWESSSTDNSEKPWEMSRGEEDILLQEFERRLAFNKIQISNFIKSHIFRRRRPIDGWKYMIEELGPNAKKSKTKLADSGDEPKRLPDS